MIADGYDKGYGHFTTRQIVQFQLDQAGRRSPMRSVRWPMSRCTPSQTSGNCITGM